MKKLILVFLLVTSTCYLMAGGMSFAFSESIRNPQLESDPVDYQITTQFKFNDALDVYYLQERTNGLNEREYWIYGQVPVYRDFYVAGKRHYAKQVDLYLLDLKYRIEKDGWGTYLGMTNCWDTKYHPKLLFEERKSFNLDFFICPFELNLYTKLLSDIKEFYHEEQVELKFKLIVPTALKMNKYFNAYVKLFILSKDYGMYRWQQKLMIEFELK